MTGASKYDMRVNPVYQVDFQAQASGKNITGTKRRVRFKFGFSHRDAIVEGCTGTQCRGEEHEVVLVWSFTSGKRLVIADGQEVHFSHGKRTDTRFETQWEMNGGHIIKLIAHMAPPVFLTPGFRQFDLQLDGCSYFSMPKIFELGTKRQNRPLQRLTAGPAAHASSYSSGLSQASPTSIVEHHHQQEHGDYYRHKHYGQRRSSPSSSYYEEEKKDEGDARSFAQPPTTPRRVGAVPSQMPVDVLSDAGPGFSQHGECDLLSSSTSTTLVTTVTDEFTPQAATPPETFHRATNEIMSAYAPTATNNGATPTNNDSGVLALANEPHTYTMPQPAAVPVSPDHSAYSQQQQQQEQQQQYHQQYYQQQAPPHQQQVIQPQYYEQQQQQQAYAAPATPQPAAVEQQLQQAPAAVAITPTMEPVSIEEMEAREQPPTMSEMEVAFKTLVNLSDINETKVTPEQIRSTVEKQAKQPVSSKPKAPVASQWHVGCTTAALSDIKANAPAKAAPRKEIMRTHAFDPAAAQAGMMVIYGTTAPMMPQQHHPALGGDYPQQHHHHHLHQQQYGVPNPMAYQQAQYVAY